MKIVVVRVGLLFGPDACRVHAAGLVDALRNAGHSVEQTTIPYSPAIAQLVPQSAALRMLELDHGFDVLIAIGPLSHALKHPNKRLWAFGQNSDFYEHWGTPYGAVTESPTNVNVRDYVRAVDRAWMAEAKDIWVASPTLAGLVKSQHGLSAQVLLPPLTAGEPAGFDASGGHLLTAGPLSDVNRFTAVVDAFAACPRAARLHILAQRTTPEQGEFLEQAIRASPRAADISLEVDFPQVRFLELARSATAFISIPFRQAALDVYSMTAIWLGRPFVTTADSGEPARFVQDAGVPTVADATPAALAETIESLTANRKLAERQAARLAESLRHQLPTWDLVAAELAR
jgi:hypothetical protein